MIFYQLYFGVLIILIVTLVTLAEAAPLDKILDVSSTESDCSEWIKHGFECVIKSACEPEGHFDSASDEEIIRDGIRSADPLFLQQVATNIKNHLFVLSHFIFHFLKHFSVSKMLKARNASCPKSWDTCCRKDTYFNLPFDNVNPDPIPTTARPKPGCGVRNKGLLGVRISGVSDSGREKAEFGEWPHMCIILQNVIQNGKSEQYYVCGASLISPGVVLTAAHCVR